jgi:hypothetical protein
MLCASREPPWADSHVMYDTTQALVDRGELNVQLTALQQFFIARDGKKYSPTPLGNVIALVPSYLAYKALRHLSFLPDRPLFALTSHLSSALMMAVACAIFMTLCRRRGASERFAFALALVLGACTLCFCYARSPYSEALQCLAVIWLVERTLSQGERLTNWGMAGLGAAAGVLIDAKLVYVLVLPLCFIYLVHAHHPRAGAWLKLVKGLGIAFAAFAPFVLALLLHNRIKTGSIFDTGYRGQEGLFTGDLFAGLYGFLLSSGKGMFFYSPPLVLGLMGIRRSFEKDRAQTILLLSIILMVLGFSAKFHVWHGDYSWGPRYTTPVTALVLLLALPWLPEALARGRRHLRQAALAGLLALGLFVQGLGASLYWDHYIRILQTVRDQTGGNGWSVHHLPHGYFIPEFSPLAGHFWLLRHLAANDPDLDRDAPWKTLLPRKLQLNDAWARLRVDWWGNDWFAGPTKAAKSGAVILLLLCSGVVVPLLALRRRRGNAAVGGLEPTLPGNIRSAR